MSDINTAPPPASAPPSAPSGNEVVINPSPVSAPTPVGSQAPEAGTDKPVPTRRDAIKNAFAKAVTPDGVKPPPRARQPKVQAKVDPEQPQLDLKKPPSAQQQHREQGRFARPPQGDVDGNVKEQPDLRGQQRLEPGQDYKPAKPLPEHAPYRDAPPRFSERGQAEWAAAPESVRGEVYRMAKEFDGAYRQYRSDHEAMEPIRQYHQMAQQHGTTLDKALNNYVSMEHKLRSDVVGGLDIIVNNLNLRGPNGEKLGIRDVAYHILNQSPEQQRLVQNQNATTAAKHQIGELHEIVGSLAQSVQQLHYDRQFGQTRSAVDQFADTHPGFDELGDLIEQELQFGFDLETAYQRAARLRPPSQARAAQTRNTPAQTRQDKSIYGAPDSGPSNGREPRKNDKPVGRREAISNAIKRVNGRV